MTIESNLENISITLVEIRKNLEKLLISNPDSGKAETASKPEESKQKEEVKEVKTAPKRAPAKRAPKKPTHTVYKTASMEEIVAVTKIIAATGDAGIVDVKSALAHVGAGKASEIAEEEGRVGFLNHLSEKGHQKLIDEALTPQEEEEEEGLI